MAEGLITRRNFLIGAGIVGVGAVVGTRLTDQVFRTEQRDVAQAAEDFLLLHQSIINGLGEETEIEIAPDKYGKRFRTGETEYTLTLEKNALNTPSGYKRTLLIEQNGIESVYTMYDERTVYLERDYEPMPMLPLNVDYIEGLSAKLTGAFNNWSSGQL